jgi:DNA-binding NarL/FixJ family response regulator
MDKKLKVLIVDDDEMMRRGLYEYLTSKGIDVLEATNANDAIELAFEKRPDAAILDIVIPASKNVKRDFALSEGVRVAKIIKSKYPEIGIVLLSAYEDRGAEVWEMVQKGVRGLVYKLKGCVPSELEEAIYESIKNRVSIDAEVSTGLNSTASIILQALTIAEKKWVDRVYENLKELTPRELEIVKCFAASRTVKGVARDLILSPKTVQNYVDKIYSKVGLMDLNEDFEKIRKSTILTKAYLIYDLRTK